VRDPVCAYIGLGANLGEAGRTVAAAVQALGRLPGTTLDKASSLYRSRPVDAAGPDFINAVAQVHTTLSAPELLRQLQQLEQEAGRERPYRNAPRTLDLDLLLFGQARISSPGLVVPHPRMRERAFVLLPLAQIAPALVGPQDLAAVAGQGIEPLPAASLPR
jgi:2-amino-4-hydroxy-6-hydroxymethyldihydropteridine diphosphokinase